MLLVTGANGFVGTGLVEALQAQGVPFRAATRHARANSVGVGEISSQTDWTSALDGIETVVHLAARVHVMNETSADPQAAFDAVNVEGSVRLARQAAARGVRRMVYVSSIKTNGESTSPGHPYRPDDQPNPIDFYGISKWKAEESLRQVAVETGLELVIVRPPLVYGPGVGGNFGSLMRLVDRSIPLPFGAASNLRSMVARTNLVSIILAAASHRAAAGEVFLASDDLDISTRGLVEAIGTALGRRPLLLPVPPLLLQAAARLVGKAGVVQRLFGSLQVDVSRTRSVLGWAPVTTMQEELARTAAAYRARLD